MAATTNTKRTILYMPNTKWTLAFALTALFQAMICLALEAYVFGEFQSSLNDRASNLDGALSIPTYLTLFIFGFLYQLLLVWDGLHMKNTIQIIGICLYNMGMLIYASVEVSQVNDAVKELVFNQAILPDTWSRLNPYLIAAPCVLGLGFAALSFIAWKLYAEFAWSIYKHISADVRMKRRYLIYQIYIALLKFDFFFFLGFTVQFLVLVRRNTDLYEFILTIIAIPVTIILLILAAFFARRESTVGQSGIFVVYVAAMAYFVFKLVRMYDSHRAADYAPARQPLTVFAVITLILLIVTMATCIMCMMNFNKGLKPHLQRKKQTDAEDQKYGNEGPYPSSGQQLGQLPPRMTID